MGSRNKCTHPGCTKPRYYRKSGYCYVHERRRLQGTPMDAPIRAMRPKGQGRVCSFPGCGRKSHQNQLCIGHYARKKNGRSLSEPISHRGKPGEETFCANGVHVLRPKAIPPEIKRDKQGRVLKARIVWWQHTGEIWNGRWLYVDGNNRNASIDNILPVRHRIKVCVKCKRGYAEYPTYKSATCPDCREQKTLVQRTKRHLTDKQVREILASDHSHSELGRRYGVPATSVSLIRRGKLYKDLTNVATST